MVAVTTCANVQLACSALTTVIGPGTSAGAEAAEKGLIAAASLRCSNRSRFVTVWYRIMSHGLQKPAHAEEVRRLEAAGHVPPARASVRPRVPLKPTQSVIAQLDPKSSGWVTAENLASYFVRILPSTCPVT